MRSLSGDPLEALLAIATGDAAQTRLVRLTSSPEKGKGWTVAQVEMVVTKDGKEPAGLAMPAANDGGGAQTADVSENQSASPAGQESVVEGQAIDARALGLDNPDEFQIFVEFPEPAALAAGEQAAARAGARGLGDAAGQIEQRSRNAIEAAMRTIKEMALQTDLMRQGIPGGSQPRMVKIKFGVSLDLQVGAFLAKSNAGATMEVELEWARRSDDVLRVLRAETDVDGALFTDADAPSDAGE